MKVAPRQFALDKSALRELFDFCGQMNGDDLERFCDGQMNAIVVAQDVFRKRFPERWQEWNDKLENGTSGLAVTELGK